MSKCWKEKIQAKQNKALQEARAIANTRAKCGISTSKNNEQFTPPSAFAKFVSKKPANIQDIYVSMFNYQQDKIKSAQNISRSQQEAVKKTPWMHVTRIP